MTETDNPLVKKHIEVPENNNRSQLLRLLSELDDDERDYISHFVSREIKPVVELGYYEPISKKYILGPSANAPTTAHTQTYGSTSAQTFTVTITAGQTWAIYGLWGRNNARASGGDCKYTDDNGTTYYPLPVTMYASGQTLCNGFWLNTPLVITGNSTGSKLIFTLTSFQAGDEVRFSLFYRRVA